VGKTKSWPFFDELRVMEAVERPGLKGVITWNDGERGEKGCIRIWQLNGFRVGLGDMQECLDALTILKSWRQGKNRPIKLKDMRLDVMTSNVVEDIMSTSIPRPLFDAPSVPSITFRPGDEGIVYPVDLLLEFVGKLAGNGERESEKEISVVGYGMWGERGSARAKQLVSQTTWARE
jgi:hypothetical protein